MSAKRCMTYTYTLEDPGDSSLGVCVNSEPRLEDPSILVVSDSSANCSLVVR